MCFVLEVDKPLLLYSIDNDWHHDRAGIDLVAGFLVVEVAGLLEPLACQSANIHQADILVGTTRVLLFVVGEVLLESAFYQRTVVSVVEVHVLQLGGEGGVATVVAPVGVEYADFGHCWVAMLLVVEVALDMFEVGKGHCQTQRVVELAQLKLGHILKTVERDDVSRLVEVVDKCFGLDLIGQAAVDGIDAVFAYGFLLGIGEGSTDDVGRGRLDDRLLAVVEQAAALFGAVGTLVELARQVFDREAEVAASVRKLFLVYVIDRRLAKNSDESLAIGLVAEVFNVVTYQHTYVVGIDIKVVEHFALQLVCFDCKVVLLFYVNSSYGIHIMDIIFSFRGSKSV